MISYLIKLYMIIYIFGIFYTYLLIENEYIMIYRKKDGKEINVIMKSIFCTFWIELALKIIVENFEWSDKK